MMPELKSSAVFEVSVHLHTVFSAVCCERPHDNAFGDIMTSLPHHNTNAADLWAQIARLVEVALIKQ
jgi:hypothetical protein